MESKDRDYRQYNPKHRLAIKRKPKEPIVRRTDDLYSRIRGFKDPVGIARLRIDFIPPSKTHEAPASDIFEVVEIDCEEKDGDDEDQDAGMAICQHCPRIIQIPKMTANLNGKRAGLTNYP